MVVCNCNRLQLITNSYVIVILIVIDDNFVWVVAIVVDYLVVEAQLLNEFQIHVKCFFPIKFISPVRMDTQEVNIYKYAPQHKTHTGYKNLSS